MTQNFDNELLSAMHDGELNSDEQTRLESQVRESKQLSSELAELTQLSALISAVPAQSVPRDLAQKVMSQIVSTPAAAATTAPPATKSKRWLGVAAMLTAAAALFLMFRFFSNPGQPEAASETVMVSTPATAKSDTDTPSANEAIIPEFTIRDSARPTPTAPVELPPPAAMTNPDPHAMTQQIATSDTSVIEINSRENDVAVLLQTLFVAEMLEHRRSKDKALDAAGLQAIVVEVNATDVSSMLTKVEAVAGIDSLSLKRDTDPASLQQKLLLAESLYESRQATPASSGRDPKLVASSPRTPAAPKPNMRARGGRQVQPVPRPSRVESQVSQVAESDSDLDQLKAKKTPNDRAGAPTFANREPAAADKSNADVTKKTRTKLVVGTDTPASRESVKVIFVMKKTPPAADNNSNPCNDIDA